jgi:peptide deformylase
MYGEPVTIEGTELLARCLQHETDHLDGIVFIDRLSKEDRKAAMKEIRESEWFNTSTSTGINPTVKLSPHSPFGKGI